MRSKCFLGSSLLLFCFVLFYFISLLPPLSRKPLLPHLQGICFTQRAPGERKTNPTPALRGRCPGNPRSALPDRLRAATRGCGSRQGQARAGAALPGWRCNAQRPEQSGERERGLENASSLLLQQGSGRGVLPSRGRVSYLQVLSLFPSASSTSLRPNRPVLLRSPPLWSRLAAKGIIKTCDLFPGFYMCLFFPLPLFIYFLRSVPHLLSAGLVLAGLSRGRCFPAASSPPAAGLGVRACVPVRVRVCAQAGARPRPSVPAAPSASPAGT